MAHRFLLLVLLLGLAVLPTDSTAQLNKIPFDLALEGSIGASRLRWKGELPRLSYLPTMTLNAAAVSTFLKDFYFQPFAGLQFDGVRFSSPTNQIDYKDHYALVSFRTGLFAMTRTRRERRNNQFIVGLGLEAQRPVYVRGSVFSRQGQEERDWVRIPDPPELERWGLYWTIRMGAETKRMAYMVDVTFNNKRATIFSSIFPSNPLTYTSLRFSMLYHLSTTHQE